MSEELESGSINTDTANEASDQATKTLMTADVEPEAAAPEEAAAADAENEEGSQEESSDAGEETIPENYDFKMPDGMEMNESLANAISPVFKDLGLTQQQADKLTGAYAEVQAQAAAHSQELFTNQLKSWKEELEKDKTFGGDSFSENSGQVANFVQSTVPAEIKDEVISFLNETGAGNHPGLVKYFHHLSKTFSVSEDVPGSGQAFSQRGKSREERMYPNN